MSGNRSIQAAQRRRAGPTSESNSNKSPQTSINSAQIFSNQSRTSSGRLGGQQENMQQQSQSQSQGQTNEKLSSVSKMTIPQAITLITLRLGSVESKLMQMNENVSSNNMSGIGNDCEGLNIESAVFQSIVSRLESLEKRTISSGGGASTPELNAIKQQFETLKQAVVQTKGSNNSLVKENILLKSQIEELKMQMLEMTESVEVLRKLTYENSQTLLNMTISSSEYTTNFDEKNMVIIDNFDEENKNEVKGENQSEDNDELSDNQSYDNDPNNIIGTDLKKLIESELSFNA